MRLTEPTTTLTDLGLAIGCGLMARRLGRAAAPGLPATSGPLLWAGALGAAAGAAGAGVVAHGAKDVGDGSQAAECWDVSLRLAGASGTLFALGATVHATDGMSRAALVLSTLGKGAATQRALAHDAPFSAAVAAVGADMALVALLAVDGALRREPWAAWTLAGIGVGAVGGAVQHAGWGADATFNHNDRFHVVQLVSYALLAIGGDAMIADRATAS